MATWNAPDNEAERQMRNIEDRAAHDVTRALPQIWRDGIPEDGDLRPVAIRYTHVFVAALSQESAAIPRWAWGSHQAMRGYLQEIGDRYYAAFLNWLSEAIARRIKATFTVPRLTPPLLTSTQSTPSSPRRVTHPPQSPPPQTHEQQQEGA